jgi:hypothetical protein
MLELIQLVDESLARHGFGSLLQTVRDVGLESSLRSRLLAETTKDAIAPNWANAQGDPSKDCTSVVMGQPAVVRVTNA